MRSSRRILLLAVAGLLSASALLAIAILLFGHLGDTSGRILATTAILGGYGLVALPSTILLDRGRRTYLAGAGVFLAATGAALAVTSVWAEGSSDEFGRTVGTVAVWALAATQVTALEARRQRSDSVPVRRLFALSCALAVVLAAMVTAGVWGQIDREGYLRLLAALAVLDLLVVALQPILARARPVASLHRLRIVTESEEPIVMTVEAADLAGAAAKAIRKLERDGRRVVRIEFADDPVARRNGRANEGRATATRAAPS